MKARQLRLRKASVDLPPSRAAGRHVDPISPVERIRPLQFIVQARRPERDNDCNTFKRL